MRESGILMHITSLPNPYGIGTLGKCSYNFVDFLKESGQAYWQILPLSPTGFGDSPYQSFSTFAGNHYLIDLDMLIEQGLLTKEEVESVCWTKDEGRVDYGCMYENRARMLRRAFDRFEPDEAFFRFIEENDSWLNDFALFMALKSSFSGDWLSWSEDILMRRADALERAKNEFGENIRFYQFLQYVFFEQWHKLIDYAHSKGIRIIGDVPIYVPLDSADVWANPELFQLDENRRPKQVAGCPPDSFSADGQLWGNPLYNWDELRSTGYDWWIRRLKAASKMYDVIRIDHFRGFESYWAVPAGESTAKNGHWINGPGLDFIDTVKASLGETDFIVEDLGFVTPEVRELQLSSGFPGMKVMQFAFDSREDGDYIPHNYPVNSVCYSSTHDNPTMKQWFEDAIAADVDYAKEYLSLTNEEGYIWGMIRACMGSVSKLCVIQMQDYLELGRDARMNAPGTLSNLNWTWRAPQGVFTAELAQRINEITRRYGRLNKKD